MLKKIFSVSTISILPFVVFLSCRKAPELKMDNQPPIANAGKNAIIVLPLDSVVLDGTGSNDPDDILKLFLWSKVSGPAAGTIEDPGMVKTTAKNLTHGVYQFELKISNERGLSAKDTVFITVDSVSAGNHPPIANAGQDLIVTLPQNSVTLDGSGSFDPDNNITSYQWTKISGPSSFNIQYPAAQKTEVTFVLEGIYQFELKATDRDGLMDTDTLQVTVNTSYASCDRPEVWIRQVPIGTLSVGRARLVAGAAGNKILFAGGDSTTPYGGSISTTRIDIYDVIANTWSTTEIPRGAERFDITVASVGNKVFFAGGRGNWEIDAAVAATTSTVNIYDVTTNSWTEAHLSQARSGMASTTLGSKIYFAGGGRRDPDYPDLWTFSNVVDIFDNETNSWSTATLSEARSDLSAAVADNKIFFAGGMRSESWLVASNRIDIYDPGTNSWTVSSMLESRSHMAGIGVGNKVLWAGGANAFSISEFNDSKSVEIWDVVSDSRSTACIIPKEHFQAVIKDDNIVFFTGYGADGRSGTEIDIYNTSTNTWSTGLMDLRIFDAAIISVNNTIYVAGGSFTGSPPFYNQVWKLEF